MSPDALSFVGDEATIKDGEEERDFPAGWERASLAQVASINPSTSFDGLPDDAVVPFIPMAAVAEETGAIDASQRRPLAAVRKGYVRFREGDVIFAKITPCMENGKIAPVCGIEGGYGAGSTEFHVLRPGCVDARYLWYWLVRRAFRGDAQHNMSGSAGQLRVPVDYLRSSSIPLPPMAEQRRIVARIDELFAEIAEGEAALERARHGLDTWRRALLKAAITGELTRDWREANPPTETVADLLARIRVERGASVPRSSRGRPTSGTLPDTPSLLGTPEGWAVTTLGAISSLITSGSRGWKQYYATSGSTFIRAQNLNTDRLNLDDVAYVELPSPTEGTRTRVHRDDILITITGANVTRSAQVHVDLEDAYVNQHVGLVRLVDPSLSGFVFLVVICPSHGRKQLEAAAYGAGKPGLNLNDLASVLIPFPPIEEQRLITRRVAAAFSEADNAIVLIDQQRVQAALLRQSILKAAFEGRLVPQDPADEPATALLARLREANGAIKGSSRRAGRPRKSTQGVLAL